jgi:hypothetical protein
VALAGLRSIKEKSLAGGIRDVVVRSDKILIWTLWLASVLPISVPGEFAIVAFSIRL